MVSFGEKKEKREEEKKRKRKRRSSQDQGQKVWMLGFLVWKLNLCMDSMRLCMNFHALLVILLPKSRVFVRVHLSPKFVESKVDKTLNSTRRS